MLVDCQTCPVRNVHCADCMVTALAAIPVGAPGGASAHQATQPMDLQLDRAERRAVSVLLAAGLVTHHEANAARAVHDAPHDAPHDALHGAHRDTRAGGRVTMAG